MSIPTIAVMLVTIAYNMADLIFVGRPEMPRRWRRSLLASPFFLLQMTLGTLIGGGGCTAVSAALGARNTARAKVCSGACVVLSLAGGVLLGGAALLFSDAFLRFFGADGTTLQFTKDYLLVLAAGTPAVVFSSAFANLVRAEGAVKEAVLFNGLGTAANIALDPLFISGLSMGVRGAAVATVIGNLLSAAAILLYLRRRSTALTLNPRHAFRDKGIFLQVLGLGVPGSVGNLLMSMTNTVANHRDPVRRRRRRRNGRRRKGRHDRLHGRDGVLPRRTADDRLQPRARATRRAHGRSSGKQGCSPFSPARR